MSVNWNNAAFELSAAKLSQLPQPAGPEVAFVGRSNVGKSSLINRVLNRKKLARTSATPGKTATINFYDVDNTVKLVDLPGYGYAKVGKATRSQWPSLIGSYLSADRELVLTVLLMDIRHEPSRLDVSMVDYLIESQIPFLIAFTKADKLSKTAAEKQVQSFASLIPCFDKITKLITSSENGTGIEQLRAVITDVASETE